MAISSPTYDPASTAAALADKYVSGQRQALQTRTTRANATEKGLTDLGAALSTFQTTLASLTGLNKTMFAQSAALSDTSAGTATASASAAPGSYTFVVEKLATASQVSYSNLTADSNVSGDLVVKVGTTSFNVNLASANTDGAGTPLTPREIAAAINGSSANTSLVTASVITTSDGKSELVLTAKNTGAASAVSLDAAGLTGSSLTGKTANVLALAQDAVIRLGSASGTPIQQSTNTFSNIDGVKMTFTKASTTPVTLTVGTDPAATTTNVQGFVDAYNKLKTMIDGLVASGDPSKGKAGGTFAGDSGVTALRERLVSMLRQSGSNSLASYGIIGTRSGTLALDTAQLTRALAKNPTGLDTLIGSASASAPSGIAGNLDTYLKGWTSSTNGQIKTRKEAVSKQQDELTTRQDLLDRQYDAAYQRYLMQFSQLQAVQSQMTNNSSMFDALFSSDKD